MKARVVVFPIKGRNWCFSRSLDSAVASESNSSPPTLRDLWKKISSRSRTPQERAESVADYVADKMSRSWSNFEKAPPGTLKSRIHSLGLRLLSGVRPSEIFLKSVSKDITKVEITYPTSLNPRLVRRRLRHIAMRGASIHRKYLYGSVSLLPVTSVLTVLPLPNIPFFWILFRAYSHWRALKGSERLLLLVSDCSSTSNLLLSNEKENGSTKDSTCASENAPVSRWVLQPSEDLERLLNGKNTDNDIDCRTISSVCNAYHLNKSDVLKYRDLQEL
ncbi:uncharacterized protein [Typha angustifolia]|uniref:uncharacterized protein isoform X1 n=1 Tax=Typha angustifolia TaxID=59011 RepID=UPI003C2EA372